MESLRRFRKPRWSHGSDTTDSHLSPRSLGRQSSLEGNGTTVEVDSAATASLQRNPSPASPTPPALRTLPSHGRTQGEQLRTGLSDPIGLSVIHEPEASPTLDIILVHGLGGTSRTSWSKHKNPELFWPLKWLPLEPSICSARVLSFGYNAGIFGPNQSTILNIADFAKDLLFQMKYAKNEQLEDLRIGKIPIVFVVHSMGGLVVKKAYILGQSNDEYKQIVQSISAILFLATPHRGTNLAKWINNILAVSLPGHSPKSYISDLKRNSPALEELNDSFRHIAPKLQIFSFYETLETAIGPGSKIMVLNKDSSILGYPGEVQASLVADHHDVCKYVSRQDSNYISVRNVLKTLVSRFQDAKSSFADLRSPKDVSKAQVLLAMTDAPEEDLNFFNDRRMQGTCHWITDEACFDSWLVPSQQSACLWLHGLPAGGKSILSAHIITHLREIRLSCQFFFFRFGDQTKRSPGALLRSIAYQLATHLPSFRRKLCLMHDEGLRLEKIDAQTLWSKVFVSCLFTLQLDGPLYWVIDALDESDSPQTLVDLLSGISSSRVPIKIIIVSRNSEPLSQAFDRLSNRISLNVQAIGAHVRDISLFVSEELKYRHGSDAFKQKVQQQIMSRASGNFLWVTLAMREILQCHTEETIQKALDDIPSGMWPLYGRMEELLAANPREEDRKLAQRVFTWVACCRRAMTVGELSQALEPEFPALLDLRHAIQAVCGQFVVVDKNSNVAMIHQTARDYLVKTPGLTFSVVSSQAHREIFTKTITFLIDPDLKAKLGHLAALPAQPFLLYASTSWHYHLNASSNDTTDALLLLMNFFSGEHVLTWIHALAQFDRLKVMVEVSKNLISFVSRKRKLHELEPPSSARIDGLELIELWAIDLVKVYAKFGPYLVQVPGSIYKLVPPFCPKQSMIYQQYEKKGKTGWKVAINGLSNRVWDDCLAQISIGGGMQALKIETSGPFFCVLANAGVLIIYDVVSLKEMIRIAHGEFVFTFAFSDDSYTLVTYGYLTTKVWRLPSGHLEHAVANPKDCRALTIAFCKDGNEVLLGADDRTVRRLNLQAADLAWKELSPFFALEETPIPDTKTNSPMCMAFSPDREYLAVCYRGYPTSVWNLLEGRSIAKCRRVADRRQNIANAWSPVDRITWHPRNGEVLGRYDDGCVFKWHPLEEDTQEVRAQASELQISADGNLFITSDISGSIKIWSYEHFALIYELSCDNGVTGLCFSPDSIRFYDANGSVCNIWEPNALIRLSETDEKGSEKESDASSSTDAPPSASQAFAELLDPITALACTSTGRTYCFGNDAGNVQLGFGAGDATIEIFSSGRYLLIDTITCSQDGSLIAFQELGGQIKLCRVPRSGKKSAKVPPLLEIKIMDGLQQLMFSLDAKHLMVSSRSSAQLWSLDTLSQVSTYAFKEFDNPRCWLNNPIDKSTFLLATVDRIEIFTKIPLLKLTEIAVDSSLRTDAVLEPANTHLDPNKRPEFLLFPSSSDMSIPQQSNADNQLTRAMITQDQNHILLVMNNARQQQKSGARQRLNIIPVSSLQTALGQIPIHVSSLPLPPSISSQIQIPLGVLSQNRLVFIDTNYWICTYRLDEISRPRSSFSSSTDLMRTESASAAEPQRHFFLPRDWLNVESLDLCQVMSDGSFLCPRKGEVAVIESGLGRAW